MGDSVEDIRRPLVRLAADEPVELVEAGTSRPTVGGTGRAHLPGWRLVVLAKGSGAVAVEPQHFGERRNAVWPNPRVARERSGHLHDGAGVVRMVVAPGQQGGPGRRAQRRRVKPVVAQPIVRQSIDRRHLDRPAERARMAKPDVVNQHHHDVRRVGRRLDFEARRGRGLTRIEQFRDGLVGFRNRQHRPIEFVGSLCMQRHRQHCHDRAKRKPDTTEFPSSLHGYFSYVDRCLRITLLARSVHQFDRFPFGLVLGRI